MKTTRVGDISHSAVGAVHPARRTTSCLPRAAEGARVRHMAALCTSTRWQGAAFCIRADRTEEKQSKKTTHFNSIQSLKYYFILFSGNRTPFPAHTFPVKHGVMQAGLLTMV